MARVYDEVGVHLNKGRKKKFSVAPGITFERDEPEGDVIVGTKRVTRKVKVEEFVRRESALDNVPDNFVERMMASSATGGQVSTKKDVIVPEGFAVSIAYNKGGYQVVPKDDL